MSKRALLAQSINIHHFLDHDRTLRLSQRSARDRAIGRELEGGKAALSDTDKVLAWWRSMQSTPSDKSQPDSGERVISVRRWLNILLLAGGILLGAGAGSLALTFDGSYPVNLLAFLGVMVGLPGVLLILTLVSMVWRTSRFGVAGKSPVSRAPHSMLQLNSWLLGLWERLSGGVWQSGYGQSNARGRFAYWQVVSFAQLFSVGFFIGALMMLALLVVATDLAFGWSTTLELQASAVHAWFAAIALPWVNVWREAVPDLALVEVSRFYRLEGDMLEARAARLGEWWPFVFMTLLVWGLLPRLLMLAWCRWRLNAATEVLLREHSEVTALLDRMSTPALALGEDVHTEVPVSEPGKEAVKLNNFDQARVVVWNEALALSGAQLALGSVLSDAELQARIQQLAPRAERVLVMVKAWEPPTLEVLDVLHLLRRQVGAGCSILITPVGLPEQDFQPAGDDVQVWSAAVAKLADPHSYVAQAEPGLITVERHHG